MSKELDVAIKAAKIAGEAIEYYFETALEHERKEDNSVVTKADLAAEEVILKEIKENFPDHKIISEEKGIIDSDSSFVWLIDPLDGTLNFSRGLPNFAVSIAMTENNKTKIAVVYNPITNSLFQAEEGKGAYWNGEKMGVSEMEDLSSSIITLGRDRDEDNKKKTLSMINEIYFKSHQRIIGSSALELAWTASGRVEGFISIGLKRWDVAGGLLLVTEAGGKVTDFEGGDLDPDNNYFVATNGRIHEDLLGILK